MIRAILFDCYGVLLGRGFEHTYAAAGGDILADEDFMHQQLTDMSAGKQSPEEFDRQIATRLNVPLSQWQSLKFAQELPDARLLHFIEDHLKPKYKIGMISNGSTTAIKRRLSAEQIGLFDDLEISAEIGLLKPDPAIYRLAAENLGVELSECIFVDDYQDYVHAAQAQGMQGILYTDFNSFKAEISELLGD